MLRTSVLLIALALTCVAERYSPLISFNIEWKCDIQKHYKVEFTVTEPDRKDYLYNELGKEDVKYQCHDSTCQTPYVYRNAETANDERHTFQVNVQHTCSKHGELTYAIHYMFSGKAPTSANVRIDLNYKWPTLKYL